MCRRAHACVTLERKQTFGNQVVQPFNISSQSVQSSPLPFPVRYPAMALATSNVILARVITISYLPYPILLPSPIYFPSFLLFLSFLFLLLSCIFSLFSSNYSFSSFSTSLRLLCIYLFYYILFIYLFPYLLLFLHHLKQCMSYIHRVCYQYQS